jgi:hypothetical protein
MPCTLPVSPGDSPTGQEVYETGFDEELEYLDEELKDADELSDKEVNEGDDEGVDDEDEHEPEVEYPKTTEHEDGDLLFSSPDTTTLAKATTTPSSRETAPA